MSMYEPTFSTAAGLMSGPTSTVSSRPDPRRRPFALDSFTEWKSIYVDFSGRLQRAQIDNQEQL